MFSLMFDNGEGAQGARAGDWNSSKPRKGFRGFESHSLRH